MQQPDFKIVHHLPTPGNAVYIKQQELDAGWCVDTHQHNYEHYGLLGTGQVIVELDGIQTPYTGPCVIPVAAGKSHRITALTPIVWFCIHGTDETDSSRIDDTLIKRG